MAITEMFFWWYSRGWQVFISKARTSLTSITDFFSMSSLVRTLFKPYRHMFLDRLVSRFIGFLSRLILLLAGTLIIIVGGIASLILIILWPIIPMLPIVGIVLSIVGLAI